MRKAGLTVNNIPQIHMKQNELTNESHCIVSSEDDDTNLHILMKLDGILSCFPITRAFTHKEIENCEDIPTMNLTP